MSDQWVTVGGIIGSIAAGIGATWASITAQQAKRKTDPAELPSKQTVSRLEAQVALIQQQIEQINKKLDDGRDRMARIDSRLDRAATEEEFQAFAATTHSQLNTISEKVGRVTGLLEAQWKNERR